jgi:tetratricopeptide (TPR) repeat protein
VFLEYVLALIQYERQNYKEAFVLLNRVIKQGSLMNPDYPNLMGKWLLQQEEYQLSVQFFEETYRRGEGEGMTNKAIALSELPEKSLALEAWDNVKKISKAEEYVLATEMLTLLSKDSVLNLPLEEGIPDVQKFRFLHYRPTLSDTEYEKVFTGIKDTRYQSVLLSEKVKTFLQNKDIEKAESHHKRLIQLPQTEDVKPYLDLATLDLLIAKNKLDDEFLKILENATFPTTLIGKKQYYEAMYYANKDSLKTINAYEQALRLLPTNVEVYKGYANFYNQKGDTDKAYNILLSGLEIQPNSISLLKAYTLQCVESGYATYVDFGLQDLTVLLTENELKQFNQELNLKKEEVKRKNQEKWSTWE